MRKIAIQISGVGMVIALPEQIEADYSDDPQSPWNSAYRADALNATSQSGLALRAHTDRDDQWRFVTCPPGCGHNHPMKARG